MKSKEKGVVSIESIVRRLYRRVRRIEALYQEVENLYKLLPEPKPEEFEEMAAGKRPLTLEVLLIGVLGEVLFHLGEANVAITTTDRIQRDLWGRVLMCTGERISLIASGGR